MTVTLAEAVEEAEYNALTNAFLVKRSKKESKRNMKRLPSQAIPSQITETSNSNLKKRPSLTF
jgi:hypothetical protein